MKSFISALLAGIIFGFGLIISELVNPMRVQGFLDITGNWDPTLAFVMAAALVVTATGYKFIFTREKPIFENTFSLPKNRIINFRLIIGAALFGVGWGLSGLCPGPAIVGLSTLNTDIIIFVVAMITGMKIFELVDIKTGD